MEPIEWILGIVFIFAGYEIWGKDEPEEPVAVEVVQEMSVVSDTPVFERGRFYQTVDGYYISDLTPMPEKPAPSNDNKTMRVTDADMAFEK